MQTDQINHDPAHTVMNTGTSLPGRPSMGAWINYGLGNETDNLPGFIVLTSIGGGRHNQLQLDNGIVVFCRVNFKVFAFSRMEIQYYMCEVPEALSWNSNGMS